MSSLVIEADKTSELSIFVLVVDTAKSLDIQDITISTDRNSIIHVKIYEKKQFYTLYVLINHIVFISYCRKLDFGKTTRINIHKY